MGARNTSTQVKEQSLANLSQHFDAIKDILKNEPYANRIAYKETEFSEDGSRKDIDIKEIYHILFASIVKILTIMIIQLLPTLENRLFPNMQMPKIIDKDYKSIFRYCHKSWSFVTKSMSK